MVISINSGYEKALVSIKGGFKKPRPMFNFCAWLPPCDHNTNLLRSPPPTAGGDFNKWQFGETKTKVFPTARYIIIII